jgi:hypothetical protein
MSASRARDGERCLARTLLVGLPVESPRGAQRICPAHQPRGVRATPASREVARKVVAPAMDDAELGHLRQEFAADRARLVEIAVLRHLVEQLIDRR